MLRLQQLCETKGTEEVLVLLTMANGAWNENLLLMRLYFWYSFFSLYEIAAIYFILLAHCVLLNVLFNVLVQADSLCDQTCPDFL